MDKRKWVWEMFFLSLALAIFLSPFASSSPDGLEKVAGAHGFLEKAEPAVWQHAFFPDYEMASVREPFMNSLIAGGAGTILVAFMSWVLGKVLVKRVRDIRE